MDATVRVETGRYNAAHMRQERGLQLAGSAERVTVIGGGLAGSEAAWQLAQREVPVTLIEMRPTRTSPAHHSEYLGELVCSNSLKSTDPDTAAGCLKTELRALDSIVLQTAMKTSVAAGGALAVDRDDFGAALTSVIEGHALIDVVREEATSLPDGRVIIATGPLTSTAFEGVLSDVAGHDRLAFFDAAAPIVEAESLDRSVIFDASRYGKGEGADYLNIPLDREHYDTFIDALLSAERVIEKEFERRDLFAACQPVEEIARSGRDALRYGPMKPVGLTDPRTGSRPWAVVQLRAENAQRTAYNLVGFQTNLKWPEQQRVFSLLPGLETAEFLRFGVMHRNTFIDAPHILDSTLAVRRSPRIRLAGQVTGTEGYLEAAASGLLAAVNTYADIQCLPPVILPTQTVFGALVANATDPYNDHYQPMHVNFGIIPPLLERVRGKRERYAAYASRARAALSAYLGSRADVFSMEAS